MGVFFCDRRICDLLLGSPHLVKVLHKRLPFREKFFGKEEVRNLFLEEGIRMLFERDVLFGEFFVQDPGFRLRLLDPEFRNSFLDDEGVRLRFYAPLVGKLPDLGNMPLHIQAKYFSLSRDVCSFLELYHRSVDFRERFDRK